jgi:hypothetical protein
MTDRNALGDWYKGVSTYTKQNKGPPHGATEWVEYGSARTPTSGVLHRRGAPDLKVEILSSAGCTTLAGGQQVCTVFARPMGPTDMIRYRLPTGGQGRATAHRLFQTPSGEVSTNPLVIQSTRRVKRAWLPATYTDQKPTGLRGSWVQLVQGGNDVGTVHAPGIGAQQVTVLRVTRDPRGRTRALVRWQQFPNPNGFRRTNVTAESVRVTTTVVPPAKWWRRLLPGNKSVVKHVVEPNPTRRIVARSTRTPVAARRATPLAGHRPRSGCTSDADCPGDTCFCKGGSCTTTDPLGCMPSFAVKGRRGWNPEDVSAAAARARTNRGSGIIDAIRSGSARVVLDKTGVKLVAR